MCFDRTYPLPEPAQKSCQRKGLTHSRPVGYLLTHEDFFITRAGVSPVEKLDPTCDTTQGRRKVRVRQVSGITFLRPKGSRKEGRFKTMPGLFPAMRGARTRIIVTASSLLLAVNGVYPQQTRQRDSKTAQTTSPVAAGQQTFSSICASCHGLDGRGGERGPDIATRPEITRLNDEETLRILRSGVPEKGMPPFADLGPAKLSDLLSYLRRLQGKGTEAPVLGDVQKGKELFSGKGGCSACHMVNGSGGFLGPELSAYGGSHSARDIREVIVSPKERAGGRNSAAEVTTKDGKSYSGLVRNEDNFSLQLQSSDGAFHFFSKSDVAAINYRKEPLMPTDYGAKLSPAELDALAAYLVQVARGKSKP